MHPVCTIHSDPKIGEEEARVQCNGQNGGVSGPCMHNTCVFNVVRPKSSSIIAVSFLKASLFAVSRRYYTCGSVLFGHKS